MEITVYQTSLGHHVNHNKIEIDCKNGNILQCEYIYNTPKIKETKR